MSLADDSAELERIKDSYLTVLSQSADGIFIADSSGRFLEANQAGLDMLGFSLQELLQLLVGDVIVLLPQEPPLRLDELRAGKAMITDRRLRRKDGSVFLTEVRSKMLNDGRMLAIVRDISTRSETQQLMERNARLEALGSLAGGIAHDFNNLLAGIFGHIELARSAADNPRVWGYLDKATATIDRARRLTGQLLTFARGGAPDLVSRAIMPFLSETVEFALAGSSLRANVHADPGLWPARYDLAQMSQVLENIVINAKQATGGAGTLDVECSNCSCKNGEIADLQAGDYVRISIKDHGPGMSPEVLRRVFDPFYTTKSMGTGLGLATAFSIVKKHGGTITAESLPGAGAAFHVFLPRGETAASAAAARPHAEHAKSGRILVMDDEPALREVLEEMLIHQGYHVTCVDGGEEALNAVRKSLDSGDPFTAMIFDLTIPGSMGGIEVARELRKMEIKTPVFLISGYSAELEAIAKDPSGVAGVLQKPFSAAQLTAMLSKL